MSKKTDRIGETNISNEGCTMKIAEYNNYNDIIVEFQDEHKYRVHCVGLERLSRRSFCS